MSDLRLKTYRRMTHCRAGHEMTDENTYFRSDNGYPQCKACHRIYSKRTYEKTKNKNPLAGPKPANGQSEGEGHTRVKNYLSTARDTGL